MMNYLLAQPLAAVFLGQFCGTGILPVKGTPHGQDGRATCGTLRLWQLKKRLALDDGVIVGEGVEGLHQ